MAQSDELEQIIRGCKAGRAESFEALVDIYAKRCYGYFYRLTGSRAVSDYLLSELYLKLATKIWSYKGGVFESWLFRTASNIFYDYLRDKQQQKRLLEARQSQEQAHAAAAAPKRADAEMADKLQVQMSRLDADTRELIMLRFYSQLSFKELAEMRAEPIGTTLSKVHRGLKKLRELMEQ